MKAKLLLVALALVMAPVALMPQATAHPICVAPGCECPPNNDGIHVHVDTNPLEPCVHVGP